MSFVSLFCCLFLLLSEEARVPGPGTLPPQRVPPRPIERAVPAARRLDAEKDLARVTELVALSLKMFKAMSKARVNFVMSQGMMRRTS